MKRRHFISLPGLALFPVAATAAGVKRTPSQAEGPYYPVNPIPLDNDLVVNAELLGGQLMHLTGRVLDTAGLPRANIKLEIWQCDGAGIYAHPGHRDPEQFDKHFTGAGAHITGRQGAYHFRTMYPVPYAARPPHIHVKLWRGERELLTSQLYLHGQTGNSWFDNKRDHLQITPAPDAQGTLTAQFDFVV